MPIRPQRLRRKFRHLFKMLFKEEPTELTTRLFYFLGFSLIAAGFLLMTVPDNSPIFGPFRTRRTSEIPRAIIPAEIGSEPEPLLRVEDEVFEDDEEVFSEREETQGITDLLELTRIDERRKKNMKKGINEPDSSEEIPYDKMSKEKRQKLEDVIGSLQISQSFVRKSLQDSKLANQDTVNEYIQKTDHFTFKPPLKFLKNYRNPCFLDRSSGKSVRRCLPYFYLAGFPKSATTDVWYRLSRHPQIAFSSKKEPHWWTRYRLMNPSEHGAGNLTFYTGYFKNATKSTTNILGDGSASTAWKMEPTSNTVSVINKVEPVTYTLLKDLAERRITPIQLIHTYTPNAKFIIMLRNPVDRLYSDYRYFEENPTREGFHQKILSAIRNFFQCLSEHDLHFCAYGEVRSRLTTGLYAVFIYDIQKIIPKENLLIINLDDYHMDRREGLRRMCYLLGLKCPLKTQIDMDFTKKMINRGETANWEGMMKKTRVLLEKFYAPFNAELVRMLGEEFVWEDRD